MNPMADLLASRYQHAVTGALGLACTTDNGNGNVIIPFDDCAVIIENTAPDDPEFLCMGLALQTPAELDPATLDIIAARITSTTKMIKGHRKDRLLILTIEMLVAPPDQLPDVNYLAAILPRAIRSLLHIAAATSETLTLEAQLNTAPTT